MTNTTHSIADALRVVAMRLEQALEKGRRSSRIDANDLLETLLAVADELDPPVKSDVAPIDACPSCGERNADRLHWQDDETVLCAVCGTTYNPASS